MFDVLLEDVVWLDFQGWGIYAPIVTSWPESSAVPCRINRVADCQVRTWWEKDVREEPWAVVEKTGWRRTPLWKRFNDGEEDGKKNEI